MDRAEITPAPDPIIQALYDDGLFVQAYHRALADWGPVASWSGAARLVLGGRILGHVGAPRIGTAMHLRALRSHPEDQGARYFGISAVVNSRGPLRAWRLIRNHREIDRADDSGRAEWLGLQARILSCFRRFHAAEQALDEAERLRPEHSWVFVERSWVLERADRYEEGLEAAREALRLRPGFTPAVLQTADLLQILERDDEALDLLERSSRHLEAFLLFTMVVPLQHEKGELETALESLDRSRDLSPIKDKSIERWLAGWRCDLLHQRGDDEGALAAAREIDTPFHKKIVEALEKPAGETGRKLLPLKFLRQHHMTCSPATLSAISRFWGRHADHLELAEKICYGGTPSHSERSWAEDDGWVVREFSLTWEIATALIDRGAPFTLTTVNPGNAHIQAVIGYDRRLRTLLVRDTTFPQLLEFLADETIEKYRSNGPRGMVLVPADQADLLEGLSFKDASLFDRLHAIQIHLKVHDRAAAQLTHDELEREYPEHPMTLRSRLVLADYDSNETEQLSATSALLELYPEDVSMVLGKIHLLRSLGRKEERLRILEEACAQIPIATPLAHQLAQEWADDARRHPEVKEVLLRALALDPESAPVYHGMGHIFWNERDFDEGRELYCIAASLDETQEIFAQSWFTAERHFHRTEEALATLRRRFLRFGSKSSHPARTLCQALYQQGRFQEGLEILDEAMQLRPDDGGLELFAAETHAILGQRGRAAELLEGARDDAPAGTWLRTAASIASKERHLVKALQLWQELLEIEPLALDGHEQVAELLFETRSLSAVLDHLESAVARFPHSLSLRILQVTWLEKEGAEPAACALREMMEIHPDVAWAHRQYAIVLANMRQFDAAHAQLELASQLEPASTNWFNVAGMLHAHQGNVEEARRLLMESMKIDVDEIFALRQLISLCETNEQRRACFAAIKQELKRQSTQGAGVLAYRRLAAGFLAPRELLEELEDLRDARTDLWQAWSAVASQLSELDEIERALAVTEKATERFPLVAELWINRAGAFRTAERHEEEIQALERALDLDPDAVTALQAIADAYDRAGQAGRSREIMEKAIERNPLEQTYHAYLAHSLWRQGEREAAFEKLTRAVELQPDYNWAWAMLVEWSERMQQPERLVELGRKATRERPREVQSWIGLAKSLQRFEDLQEKLDTLDKALELAPRCIEAHDLKAHTLADAQRYDEALEACLPAVFAGNLPTQLVGSSGWIEGCRGRFDEAVKILEPLVQKEPRFLWGWGILLECHLHMADKEGYARTAREMARLLPTDPDALGRRAEVLLEEGDRKGAKADLLRALNLSPDFTQGSGRLFELYLEDDEIDEAAALADRMAPHLDPSDLLLLRVRVAAARKDGETASTLMLALCAQEELQPDSIRVAAAAMDEADLGEHSPVKCLEEALSRPGVNPVVGPALLRLCGEKKDWSLCAETLDGLDTGSELWPEMAAAYVEALCENGEGQRLVDFIRQKKLDLQRHDRTWASVGMVYASASLNNEALDWMSDWKRRESTDSWMLLNLVIALRAKKRDREARTASRRALMMEPDHCTPCHEIWLALDEALSGDTAAAQARMSRLGSPDVSLFYQCLVNLIAALMAMTMAEQEGAPAAFAMARQRLEEGEPVRQEMGKDRLYTRLRRRVVMAIASRRGGLAARFWALRAWLRS